MTEMVEIRVPPIGDFDNVEVIEILTTEGAEVNADQSVVSLESDKATMELPSPIAGTISTVCVAVGDKVTEGTTVAKVVVTTQSKNRQSKTSQQQTSPPSISNSDEIRTEVLVLGAGPGGYTAAFRASDLGLQTVLVERFDTLGGVCLNVGCIPSKTLLHTAGVITQVQEIANHGVTYSKPTIDLKKLINWKENVVGKLTHGLSGLAKRRKIDIVTGIGKFVTPNQLIVTNNNKKTAIHFQKAIIAAGSQAVRPTSFPNDKRLMDSTDALALTSIPERLLIIGGGIIGLELAAVYHALGSKITIVELMDELMSGCDRDLIVPLQKRIESQYENIHLKTKVTKITAEKSGMRVSLDGIQAPDSDLFDKVLLAVGRTPNGALTDAEKAGVTIDKNGYIPVDSQQRTNVDHIFAIGDIVGPPMLAHKATHEGKVAAEVCAGLKSSFEAATIPNVAYTDPEIAWTGLTEDQCKAQDITYEKGGFPWGASGRALGINRTEGFTKLLFEKDTKRIIGAGIVGPHAGDLIAEATLAVEMGSDAADLSLTIHPHPTLSETLNFAAEIAEGTITDLYIPKKRKTS